MKISVLVFSLTNKELDDTIFLSLKTTRHTVTAGPKLNPYPSLKKALLSLTINGIHTGQAHARPQLSSEPVLGLIIMPSLSYP